MEFHDVAAILQEDGKYTIRRWSEPGTWLAIAGLKDSYDESEIGAILDTFMPEGDTYICNMPGTCQLRQP